jgi:hypothetical protein
MGVTWDIARESEAFSVWIICMHGDWAFTVM